MARRGFVSPAEWFCPGHIKLARHNGKGGAKPCPLCCGWLPVESKK